LRLLLAGRALLGLAIAAAEIAAEEFRRRK